MKAAQAFPVVALLAALAVLAGCQNVGSIFESGYQEVAPVVDVEQNSTILVVPFSQEYYGFYESADGMKLAELVTVNMRAKLGRNRLAAPEDFQQQFIGQDRDNLDFGGLTLAESSVDYVMVGALDVLRTKNPLDVNVMRGTAQVRVSIYDVRDYPTDIWHDNKLECRYPSQEDVAEFIPMGQMSEQALKETLMERTAQKLAELFYTHREKVARLPAQ